MRYRVFFLDEALATLQHMPPTVAQRIVRKIERMRDGLVGDVKRLKAFTPSYRLRVGDWRVLFEVQDDQIIIHLIRHRSKAYD